MGVGVAWLVSFQNWEFYLEAVFESIGFLVIFFLPLKVCRMRQCQLVTRLGPGLGKLSKVA